MYLSQLILDPLNRFARIDLSNPYELHRTLMRGFPTPLPKDERVLFRLEHPRQSRDNVAVILVQSVYAPDWSVLQELESYLLADPAVKSLDDLVFQRGQRLRFRLRANPSQRLSKTGNRVGLLHPEEQLAWLERKGTQAGFRIGQESVLVHAAEERKFFADKPEGAQAPRKKSPLTIQMVDFEGILEVCDPQTFRQGLLQGIGPAKGFGCGLLSLAPA